MKNSFWGAWNSWYFLEGWTVDAGLEPTCTYEEQIRVPPPPPLPRMSVRCYVDWRAHLNVKQNVDPDELTYQKSLFKKSGKNWVTNTFQGLNVEYQWS